MAACLIATMKIEEWFLQKWFFQTPRFGLSEVKDAVVENWVSACFCLHVFACFSNLRLE